MTTYDHENANLIEIRTPDATLTINPPRSRLARALWRWLGVNFTIAPRT